ncbi:MAG TPA: hypothetical protein VF665_02660 [Longimicrobium sp.]|jgi:hypothetical protein|uniref:hypothetical protein n=1 Tax=Longimicrobium sp. TaxID=2029185 RepID=UPI002ED99A46
METQAAVPVNARLVLPGHPDAPAHVTLVRASGWARVRRTLLFGMGWISGTVTMFAITLFDPFMTALPFLIGGLMTFRSWRGRFRVTSFRGSCPRCHQPLDLKPGARIGAPHPLVCYNCHHEPELYLAA